MTCKCKAYAKSVTLLIVAFYFIAAPLPAKAQDERFVNLKSAIETMAYKIGVDQKSNVSVFELKINDPKLQGTIGKQITDKIVNYMHFSGFKLLERSEQHLKKIGKEIKLGYSDYMDQSKVAEIGKRIGARSVLSGTIRTNRDGYEINFRIVEVETTRIVGVGSCFLPKTTFSNIERNPDPPIVLPDPTPGANANLPKPIRTE